MKPLTTDYDELFLQFEADVTAPDSMFYDEFNARAWRVAVSHDLAQTPTSRRLALAPFVQPPMWERLQPFVAFRVAMAVASVMRRYNNMKAAVAWLRKAVALVGSARNPTPLSATVFGSHVMFCLGHALQATGELAASKAAILSGLETLGTARSFKRYRAQMLVQLGATEMQLDNFKAALPILHSAYADLDPIGDIDQCIGALAHIVHAAEAVQQHAVALDAGVLLLDRCRIGRNGTSSIQSACGGTYALLGQYEQAKLSFSAALSIAPEGSNWIIMLRSWSAKIDQMVTLRRRCTFLGNHGWRMCNGCSLIREGMSSCGGCDRAWYCSEQCQRDQWSVHRPDCDACYACSSCIEDAHIAKCGQCRVARYCNAGCQRAHWPLHKLECKK